MNRVPISFDVFGHAFLWHAVTASVIGKQIDALPRQIKQHKDGLPLGATADIVVTLGGCSVQGKPDAFFTATVPLHIEVAVHAIGIVNETYGIDAQLPLRLTIETWGMKDASWGLWIHARVDPVQPAQLPVRIQHEAGSSLVQIFGNLETLIPQELATAINQNLEQGDSGRWVDVARMIQQGSH